MRALSFTKKNFVVTKREFSRVVKRPLDQAFSITNIKAGFAKSGIYPFNPDSVAKHHHLCMELDPLEVITIHILTHLCQQD